MSAYGNVIAILSADRCTADEALAALVPAMRPEEPHARGTIDKRSSDGCEARSVDACILPNAGWYWKASASLPYAAMILKPSVRVMLSDPDESFPIIDNYLWRAVEQLDAIIGYATTNEEAGFREPLAEAFALCARGDYGRLIRDMPSLYRVCARHDVRKLIPPESLWRVLRDSESGVLWDAEPHSH